MGRRGLPKPFPPSVPGRLCPGLPGNLPNLPVLPSAARDLKPLLRAGVFAVLLLTAAGLSFFAGSNEEAPALTETNQTEVQDSQETAVSEIWVHVAGAVAQPGVVKIPEGSRVIEAIEAAGGLLPEADSTNLNFAAQAQDGQKINVAYAGESASR